MIKLVELEVKCFTLKYTLECGQCFRWDYIEQEDVYIGVIHDRVIKIWQKANMIYVESNNEENLKNVIQEYFDLYKDYFILESKISKIDTNIYESLKHSSGIRILRQPLVEIIISYIISANNNIKRISKSVNLISQRYGDRISFDGKDYFLFPTLEQLKSVTIEDFLSTGVGFRARYIKNTVEKLIDNSQILEKLKDATTEQARQILLEFQGVGTKVADCILLFSIGRSEVFPVDVWVKRIMEKLYFKKNTSMEEILAYAKEHFREDAGIVQQHLFYNVREGNI